MKRRLMTAFLSVALIAPWGASFARDRYTSAKVVDVEPIYERVEVPDVRQECWTEEVAVRNRSRDYSAPILGGIIGGVIGNQVSRGRGRPAATIAGSLLGATIGADLRNRNQGYHTETIRRCRDVDEYYTEERIVGYRVTYRYRGENYVTRMDRDPGDEIRVRVSVDPIY